MLTAAFVILALAVVLGGVLAVLHLQTAKRAAPRLLAALHGLLAIAGLLCLLVALRGPPRGLDQGTSGFGTIAAVLFALAALVGAGLFAARVANKRINGFMIGVHATLAISGFVILAAYLFVG